MSPSETKLKKIIKEILKHSENKCDYVSLFCKREKSLRNYMTNLNAKYCNKFLQVSDIYYNSSAEPIFNLLIWHFDYWYFFYRNELKTIQMDSSHTSSPKG